METRKYKFFRSQELIPDPTRSLEVVTKQGGNVGKVAEEDNIHMDILYIGEIQANTWYSIMEHPCWAYLSIKTNSVENKLKKNFRCDFLKTTKDFFCAISFGYYS